MTEAFLPLQKQFPTSTGGVSTKLVSLAKNIAIGVGILALVAVAAVIFVGAIWVIGELLQKSWRSVGTSY